METIIATGMLTTIGYSIYRQLNPTIDDLKYRQRQRDFSSKLNCEVGEMSLKHSKWEEECIKQNKILPSP